MQPSKCQAGAMGRKRKLPSVQKRFGSQAEVEQLTGISRRTLQKDRGLGIGLTWYRYRRKILYDLAEVERFIRETGSDRAS